MKGRGDEVDRGEERPGLWSTPSRVSVEEGLLQILVESRVVDSRDGRISGGQGKAGRVP